MGANEDIRERGLKNIYELLKVAIIPAQLDNCQTYPIARFADEERR